MQNFDLFRLDGHTLRVFCSVCETGSVSRTAELFDLNQSTISHTIEKMRSAVGDPLFVKSGRGITPTDKALAILPRVQKILSDIEGLVAAERYDASKDTKPVVLAIPTPALLHDVKRLRSSLLAIEPSTVFELRRLARSDDLTKLLTQNEADLAISPAEVRYPATLNHCHYGEDSLVIFYDPECRQPVRTLEDYTTAWHGRVNFSGNSKGVVERAMTELGVKRRATLVAPTASMLGDLIRGTDIVATMPKQLAVTAYRHLAFCQPPFPLPRLQYDLV
ncbi:MAG: LysR family transcriptional regulator [Pseudomonadota bacterium]